MKIVLALLAALASGPVHALSCLPPDIARDYKQAAASEDTFVVVAGTLRFDEERLPDPDLDQMEKPPQTDIPARLSGRSLGPEGFERPFDRAITLRILCFGPWCGGAATKTDYLTFLKRDGQGYVMTIDPCGWGSYPDPSPDVLERVHRCFTGGACEEVRY